MGGILGFRLRRVQNAFLPVVLWPVWVISLVVLFWKASFYGDSFVLCLGLGATLGAFREMKPEGAGALAHAIAKYSYGIYLAHVPLYWLCFDKLPITSQGASWALFLVLVVVVPVFLFHAVESPMIALGRRLTTTRGAERLTPAPMPKVAGNRD
jgi:peptidoglycan/LPS O-acetylase OafA/YrhL